MRLKKSMSENDDMSGKYLGIAIESLIDQAALDYGQSPLYGAVVPFITQHMILNYLEKQDKARWRESMNKET